MAVSSRWLINYCIVAVVIIPTIVQYTQKAVLGALGVAYFSFFPHLLVATARTNVRGFKWFTFLRHKNLCEVNARVIQYSPMVNTVFTHAASDVFFVMQLEADLEAGGNTGHGFCAERLRSWSPPLFSVPRAAGAGCFADRYAPGWAKTPPGRVLEREATRDMLLRGKGTGRRKLSFCWVRAIIFRCCWLFYRASVSYFVS